MTIVTVSAKGRIQPDEVWDRYVDISRWPEWAPQIQRVDATAEQLAFGVTGRVFGPLGTRVEFTVESVDEQARKWSWTVRRWPLAVHLEHAVAKRGGGSSTSLRLDGPLPVVVAYAPLARLALQRLVSKNPPTIATPDKDADGNLRA